MAITFNQKLETIAQQKQDVIALTHEFNESIQTFEESFQDESESRGAEQYQTKVRLLYKDYYTGPVPGRWDELRSAYRDQLAKDIEAGTPLEEVHARVLEEKRQARISQKEIISEWRERELSNHPGDHPETVKFKLKATAMLNNDDNTLEDVLKYMNDEAHKVISLLPGQRHDLLDQINMAKTPEQKRQARKEWHTTIYEEDSPQIREHKQQLSRMFESPDSSLEDIDDFVIQYKKQQDIRNVQHEELIKAKKSEIEENGYAWRAHIRAKKEKAERVARKARERRAALMKINTHRCSGFDESGDSCRNPATPEDEERGPPECAVCTIAIENGCDVERSFFCSVTCAMSSWATHISRVHPCDADNCLSTPTPNGADCPECEEIFDKKSTFCSLQCLESNKESHFEKVHEPLREKMKQHINQELESEFSRFQRMTEEELEEEIRAMLQDDDVLDIEPEEFEEMKRDFAVLDSLSTENSPGRKSRGESEGRDRDQS